MMSKAEKQLQIEVENITKERDLLQLKFKHGVTKRQTMATFFSMEIRRQY